MFVQNVSRCWNKSMYCTIVAKKKVVVFPKWTTDFRVAFWFFVRIARFLNAKER